jgi:glycosyltransferase involved in cell wall biosynthesis
VTAVKSVLSQTYKNVEVIIVDDCSDDDTLNIVKQCFSGLKYIKNKKNVGLSAARNIGIENSSGEYISFLDDDDELLPDKIKLQMDVFFKDSSIDVVYCGCEKKYAHSSFCVRPELRGYIFPKVLKACPNAVHTLLVRRNCFDVIGFFDESLARLEDYDMWVRLSKKFKFDFVDKTLVVYNIHGDQMTSESMQTINARAVFLEKYEKEFLENKKFYFWHLRRQATKYAFVDDYDSFYNCLLKAMSIMPFSPSLYLHFVLSLISRRFHKFFIESFLMKPVDGVLRF